MEGKINKEGQLEIIKGGQILLQFCPFTKDFCSEDCALFGEPVPELGSYYDKNNDVDYKETGKIELELCHKTLIFDKFTDERE
jgi:hypothetical protein